LKWCGKSAPRLRQRRRHGKPHREQDQIGMARDPFPDRRPGRSREACSNARPRGMAIGSSKDGSQNPAYRPSDVFSLHVLLHCRHGPRMPPSPKLRRAKPLPSRAEAKRRRAGHPFWPRCENWVARIKRAMTILFESEFSLIPKKERTCRCAREQVRLRSVEAGRRKTLSQADRAAPLVPMLLAPVDRSRRSRSAVVQSFQRRGAHEGAPGPVWSRVSAF